MTTFSQIATLGRRTADMAPVAAGMIPVLGDEDEIARFPAPADKTDAASVALAIEYRDAEGAESRRRVTVLSLRSDAAGNGVPCDASDSIAFAPRSIWTASFTPTRPDISSTCWGTARVR